MGHLNFDFKPIHALVVIYIGRIRLFSCHIRMDLFTDEAEKYAWKFF